jgi:hypothetical protein
VYPYNKVLFNEKFQCALFRLAGSFDLLWAAARRPRPPRGGHNRIRWSAVGSRTHTPRTPLRSCRDREVWLYENCCHSRQAEIYWDSGIYVGNGLRFAEIRLSRLEKHTHTHTLDTHARLPTSESGCGRPARELRGGRISGLGPRRPTTCQARFVARRGGPQQPVSSEQRPCRGLCRRGGNVECRARHRIS